MAETLRRTGGRERIRRAHWKASTPDLVPGTVDGREHVVPRRLVRAYRWGPRTR
ncbi:50S ribosomal protein L32 [Kitasatospora purpeofusca]